MNDEEHLSVQLCVNMTARGAHQMGRGVKAFEL